MLQHTRASAQPPVSALRPLRTARRVGRAAQGPARQRDPAPADLTDRERAVLYIAAKRACGLLLFPSRGSSGKLYLGECGFDEKSGFTYGAATKRFLKCPEIWWDFPPGVLGEAICADFGIDPADPDLNEKVHAHVQVLRAEHAARHGRAA